MKSCLRGLTGLLLLVQLHAQTSPGELGDMVMQRWAAGTAAEFAAVYPFADGREMQARLRRDRAVMAPGLARVIASGPGRAAVLIAGAPRTGNAGDDTMYSMSFSGVYEAVTEGGRWRLERRVPLEEMGQIVSQRLKVRLRPGQGVDVEDRLLVRVKGGNGFATVLNHRAKLEAVREGAAEVRHEFGGGLLWVAAPAGETELTVRYSLDVETAPDDPNSARFTEVFGHMRNQYFWHPAFGFENGAEVQVEVRAPKEFAISTSLPQTERVEGEERVIAGKSVRPTALLTLAYDRDWKVRNEKAGDVRMELFLTPDFKPEPGSVVEEFGRVYSLLAERFGAPQGGYVAIVQLRACRNNGASDGWHFNSNQGVYADGSPGDFSVGGDDPAAKLGHEVAHYWTRGTGPATAFLQEGWADYAQGIVLEREYGRETADRFWRQQARKYFTYYDGKKEMWNSGNWGDLNYYKGSWVFRMLEDAAGSAAFRKAMAEFSRRSLAGEAGWETLAECFQRQNVADFDARGFLLPWLKEKGSPHLTAEVAGQTVTIVQDGANFVLPVTIEATTAAGVERKRVWVKGSRTAVGFGGPVTRAEVDPDGVLLLLR